MSLEQEITEYRSKFQQFLKENPSSPLTEDQKTSVQLQFFPSEEKFRVEAKLEEFPKKREKEMVDKEGFPRKLSRYGKLRFSLDGINCALEIFKEPENDLFLAPFNDLTSGKETYGAGRFVEPLKSNDETFIIDFNKAYNPYCAYNPQRSCPMPYARNRLPVSIPAGEKNPVK